MDRKESIENWFENLTNEDIDEIITNSGDKIQLFISGLSESHYDITSYRQYACDIKWFDFVKQNCKNRQEVINQIRGTIEMLLEDEDFYNLIDGE